MSLSTAAAMFLDPKKTSKCGGCKGQGANLRVPSVIFSIVTWAERCAIWFKGAD